MKIEEFASKAIGKNGRPNVLFVGNGIFYSKDFLWKDVIENYLNYEKTVLGQKRLVKILANSDDVPNTIKVLPATLSGPKLSERINDVFSTYTYKNTKDYKSFVDFIDKSNIDVIITTNYTYDIEKALDDKFNPKNKSDILKKYVMSDVGKKEQKYFIYTYNLIKDFLGQKDRNILVWHIHGELRNPSSVVLSHDLYGKLMNKMIDYIKNNNWQVNNGILTEWISWIDYFIYGNVYFVGYSLDYSEMDLWWLINQRAHISSRGEMYFYHLPINKKTSNKMTILDNFNIITKTLSHKQGDKCYSKFYKETFNDILNFI